MKHFPKLRTRRITAQLQELSIGDAITVASMPEHMAEAECTAFLSYAIKEAGGELTNPADWTVQERALVVAHYLAAVSDDGPDFSLGNKTHYSDYLDGESDISLALKQVPVGEVAGDQWEIRHLTGGMAEAIERLIGEIEQLKTLEPRLHWILGSMAAQLVRTKEEIPELTTDGIYDEWLLERMKILMAFPESDFAQLMGAYQQGREKLHHLFAYDFTDEGIVILAKKGGAEGLSSARFPVSACLSKLALTMAGKPHRSSGQS
jgi:hypothetical protein